jgi:hypothetical protein
MINNKNILLIGEMAILATLLGALTFEAVSPRQAAATTGMSPFGGPIIAVVPPIPFPPCPAHTVITNYADNLTSLTKTIGIYVVPTSQIYMYGNLITPTNFVLGEYVPVPFPTCSTPYPVYPIFQVGTGGF